MQALIVCDARAYGDPPGGTATSGRGRPRQARPDALAGTRPA
jgi:hypothetical protein